MKKIIMLLSAVVGLNIVMSNAYALDINHDTLQTEVTGKKALLLDVRSDSEYAKGHISNSILVPHDVIGQKITEIAPDKKQKLYIYCRSGARSALAAATVKSMGYENVIDLGSIENLEKNNYPVVKPKS